MSWNQTEVSTEDRLYRHEIDFKFAKMMYNEQRSMTNSKAAEFKRKAS